MQRIANGGSGPQGAQSSRVMDSYVNLGNQNGKAKALSALEIWKLAREDGNEIPFQPPQEAASPPWQKPVNGMCRERGQDKLWRLVSFI